MTVSYNLLSDSSPYFCHIKDGKPRTKSSCLKRKMTSKANFNLENCVKFMWDKHRNGYRQHFRKEGRRRILFANGCASLLTIAEETPFITQETPGNSVLVPGSVFWAAATLTSRRFLALWLMGTTASKPGTQPTWSPRTRLFECPASPAKKSAL